MIDVDELFRCPLSRDKELKKQIKVTCVQYPLNSVGNDGGIVVKLLAYGPRRPGFEPGLATFISEIGCKVATRIDVGGHENEQNFLADELAAMWVSSASMFIKICNQISSQIFLESRNKYVPGAKHSPIVPSLCDT